MVLVLPLSLNNLVVTGTVWVSAESDSQHFNLLPMSP